MARDGAPPPGAQATPVTSALRRAPGGAVPRQDPLAERRRFRTQPPARFVVAGHSNDFPLPSRAAPALAVRGRLSRSGKSSRLVRSLRSVSRRVRMRFVDRCQAELLPVVSEIYADHKAGTRRVESPRRFSCFAARGPLQTAAAVQHRHDASGQRSADSVGGETMARLSTLRPAGSRL